MAGRSWRFAVAVRGARLMKFQQAYMASSRVMQAANDTFNTILQLR